MPTSEPISTVRPTPDPTDIAEPRRPESQDGWTSIRLASGLLDRPVSAIYALVNSQRVRTRRGKAGVTEVEVSAVRQLLSTATRRTPPTSNTHPTPPKRDAAPHEAETRLTDLATAMLTKRPACAGDARFVTDIPHLPESDLRSLETICRRCPVVRECGAYARAAHPAAGVWAGASYAPSE